MFTSSGMSPQPYRRPATASEVRTLVRLTATAGGIIHDERIRRRWSMRELARRAGVSPSHVAAIEAGEGGSLEMYVRLGLALGLRPGLSLDDPRRRSARPDRDVVHSAMAEILVARFRSCGFGVGVDEPFQHYQFAGRADVLAWDVERRALLHVENRTRFPNLQEVAGSFNAKRAYLPAVIAERIGLRGGWQSVTHVIASLWSSEVLHVIRLRTGTFRALCPDPPSAFRSWWAGDPPTRGISTSLIVLDPRPDLGRRQRFADLDDAMSARPRYRGYAHAAETLEMATAIA